MDFLEITRRIAAGLGPGWRAEPGYMTQRHSQLFGPGDQSLMITHGDDSHRRTDHGRLRVVGTYQPPFSAFRCSGDTDHHITVAAHRPPADIAAAIERRLLPGYRQTLDGYRRSARADAVVLARRDAILEELAAMLAPVHRLREDGIEFGHHCDPVSASIRVLRSGDAEIAVRVDRDHVLDLARHLATLRPGTAA
ncbi:MULTISPECIES: hypothetical protein [Nocardia]|uniref:hypothetical protein n=1 Tax=Nocardia TaxID=1817 RepID=UPI000D68A2DB|nr:MULTISPECIES: hypothetical protein [Nocardia]